MSSMKSFLKNLGLFVLNVLAGLVFVWCANNLYIDSPHFGLRDIGSLLFIILTFIYAFRLLKKQHKFSLIVLCVAIILFSCYISLLQHCFSIYGPVPLVQDAYCDLWVKIRF